MFGILGGENVSCFQGANIALHSQFHKPDLGFLMEDEADIDAADDFEQSYNFRYEEEYERSVFCFMGAWILRSYHSLMCVLQRLRADPELQSQSH